MIYFFCVSSNFQGINFDILTYLTYSFLNWHILTFVLPRTKEQVRIYLGYSNRKFKDIYITWPVLGISLTGMTSPESSPLVGKSRARSRSSPSLPAIANRWLMGPVMDFKKKFFPRPKSIANAGITISRPSSVCNCFSLFQVLRILCSIMSR